MTMSNLEVGVFNLVDQHGSTKGFRLKTTPTIDASNETLAIHILPMVARFELSLLSRRNS